MDDFSFKTQGATVTYDACEIDNSDGGMNMARGFYKAPTDGTYLFHFGAYAKNDVVCNVMKGDTKIYQFGKWDNSNSTDVQQSLTATVVTEMSAGEELSVNFGVWSDSATEGSLLSAPISSGTSRRITFFGVQLA